MKFENLKKMRDILIHSSYDLELIIFLISYVLMGVFKDLKMPYSFKISSAIFAFEVGYLLCSCIFVLVITLIERHDRKKHNKSELQKMLDDVED